VWNEDNVKEQGNDNPIVFDELKGKVSFKRTKKNQPKTVGIKAILVATADEKMSKYFITTDSTGVFAAGSKELKKGEGGYVYLELDKEEKLNFHLDFSDDFFKEINNNRKSKSLVYPVSALQEIKPEAASPFVDRKTITKLKEVLITSKNKKGFSDKYMGKLDSLARLDRLSNYRCVYGTLNCTIHPQPRYNLDITEAELLEMFNVVMIEGYYGKKVFYEAVYDEITINDSLPDFRNTLFWKSDVITNEQGESSVDFFCSDINSLFIGNIEGVSGNGLLGADNFEFKVKEK
jgi:hypothetical protein